MWNKIVKNYSDAHLSMTSTNYVLKYLKRHSCVSWSRSCPLGGVCRSWNCFLINGSFFAPGLALSFLGLASVRGAKGVLAAHLCVTVNIVADVKNSVWNPQQMKLWLHNRLALIAYCSMHILCKIFQVVPLLGTGEVTRGGVDSSPELSDLIGEVWTTPAPASCKRESSSRKLLTLVAALELEGWTPLQLSFTSVGESQKHMS